MLDLLLTNGRCVVPAAVQNIGIEAGKITYLGSEAPAAKRVKDLEGLTVLPGVIDSQVHFREPGLTHKEDLESGSKSAVLGGVSTFLEMPNTHPSTTTKERIQEKVQLAREKSYANFGFFVGATGDNNADILAAYDSPGCCGIKIFLGSSTGDLLLYDEKKLRRLFLATQKIPTAVHSENELMLRERVELKKKATSVHAHYEWRDVETALSSTQRILHLARECSKRLHILHISTQEEIEFLKSQKDICTVEVTPQHLSFNANDYDELGTYLQMNPPIRPVRHQEALWKGLKNGTVDIIGSDHAPHTKAEKEKGYPLSPSGMPGVQTLLPVMLDHVNSGQLTLEHLVKLVCEHPAELYQLKGKGKLEIGYDADITVVDLEREHIFTNEEMATKSGWSPFQGKKVKGMPVQTWIAGKLIMEEGQILAAPESQPVC